MLNHLLSLALAVAPVLALQDIPADKEVQTTASGLKYSILEPGAGEARPSIGAKVKVHYTGWLTDGTKFDSSVGRAPFEVTVGVGQVIKGWDEGLQLMPKGARYKFTIPGELAYGAKGMPPTIPANATLVFEVQMLEFGEASPLMKYPPANPAAEVKTESGLVYEVLEKGKGAKAKAGERAVVRYTLWNDSKKLLDSSALRGTPIQGELGSMPLPFLDELIPLVELGSRVRAEVPPALGWGERAMSPDLPANSRTTWLIELVQPLPVPIFQMPPESELTKTQSGLAYRALRPGSGTKPTAASKVRVHYAGWTTEGKLFDSSYQRGEPAEFPLRNVIRGWTEGLQLMEPGAAYLFVIPGELAYGPAGKPPTIAPNATLVFHVELLGIIE